MRFLIIGLGSMGKRRIRCLLRLGFSKKDIYGYDVREDRKIEAKERYGISIIEDLDETKEKFDALIISTPPDHHVEYLNYAIERGIPAFVELNVILEGLDEISKKVNKNTLIAPSCTMIFHPIIKDIYSIVKKKSFGNITNFSYHSGQYIYDWHPWEDIKEFFVSKRETGGARELMAFELNWITKVFGYPKRVSGYFGRTMDLKCDIDDTYAVVLDFGNFFGTIIVDVVSRLATRRLTLNLENAQLYWDWNSKEIKIYEAFNYRNIIYTQPEGTTIQGYNRNIIEEMYIEELKTFIDAIKGKAEFPNTLDEDIKVLTLLQQIEGGILP